MAPVPPTLMRPLRMLSFKKGSFQASTVAEFTWAFKGLSLGPMVKPDMAVLYALHDVVDSPALRVLILHNQELQFSGVFVISHWQPPCAAAAAAAAAAAFDAAPPVIYACAHLISYDTLPTFDGREADFDFPVLKSDVKRSHQRRAMIVKSHAGDDAVLIGFWERYPK